MNKRTREITNDSVRAVLKHYGVFESQTLDEIEPDDLVQQVSDILNDSISAQRMKNEDEEEKAARERRSAAMKVIGHLNDAREITDEFFPWYSHHIVHASNFIEDILEPDLAAVAVEEGGSKKEPPTGGRNSIYDFAVRELYWCLRPWIDQRRGPAIIRELLMLFPENADPYNLSDMIRKTYLPRAKKKYREMQFSFPTKPEKEKYRKRLEDRRNKKSKPCSRPKQS